MKTITLLSDFGTADGYVAAMKGVILSACPDARIIDATHEIPPHDVRAGAWALRHYALLYPPETIHVAVVDPGVGTVRAPLLVRVGGHWLIGPDNGLFSWVLQQAGRSRSFRIRPDVHRAGAPSRTFHGRDVFAHVAGLLAAGADWRSLVASPVRPVRWRWATPRRAGDRIAGEIVHVDRFGNAISNIPAEWVRRSGPRLVIRCNEFTASRLCATYADVKAGATCALEESTGLLELAVREGNAAHSCRIAVGDHVVLLAGRAFPSKAATN